MRYVLPELTYDYGDLAPHYDPRLLELHHGKHHAAYVAGLNQTLERLEEARAKGDFAGLVGLEKALAFHLSGHVLHSLFWRNLGPKGADRPGGELAAAIEEGFGSWTALRAQLEAATVGVQGSGWGALVWEPLGKRLIVEQIQDHQDNTGAASLPLLVVDAWEHAYYLQHQNRRKDYFDAIWQVIDWQDVEARFARCLAFEPV